MSWKVFAVVPLLLFTSLSARADGPDLTFSNPGTVITAPTDVAVNLVMPGDADRQAVAALLIIEYDPAIVTLSNPRAANPTLWSDFTVYSAPDAHQLRVLMLTNGYASGQTTSGPLMYVTVTPVGSSADLSVCATLRLVGGAYGQELTCNLAIYRPSLNDYDSVWAASSCGPLGPIYVPPGENGSTTSGGTSNDNGTEGATGGGSDGPTGPNGPTTDTLPDVRSCLRVLRFVAGLYPDPSQLWDRGVANDPLWKGPTRSSFFIITDPNTCPPTKIIYDVNDINTKAPPDRTVPPNTMVDQATLELSEPGGTINNYVSGYDLIDWTVPDCPPYFDGYGRHFTIADAIMALRIPLTGPPQAAWRAGFIGNILSGGFPANSTGMPAISLLKPQLAPSMPPDLSNPWIAAFPMGTQNGTNAPDPTIYYNTNSVYLLSDLTGNGGYGIRSGWPQFLPDAPDGASLADINGDGNVEVMAPDFQDAEGAHLFVWDYTGSGIAPFAPYNLHSASAVGTGHSDATASLADITGDNIPELFFPYQGIFFRPGSLFGGIKVVAANGTTLYTAEDHSNMPTPWSTFDGYFQSQFDAPPVLMPKFGSSSRIVVAGANSGDIYAWRTDTGFVGQMQSGFPIQLPPPAIWDADGTLISYWGHDDIFDPVGYQIAADVDNDDHPELLFATGRHQNYADFDRPPHASHNDGAIYCYRDTGGQPLWRYPSALHNPQLTTDWTPAFASGLSIGRLHGPTGGLYVVAVDASGLVVALNASNGSVLWTYDINPIPPDAQHPQWHKTEHRYFRGAVAQPIIADLNSDGNQDVIIGTTHGEIYILDGNPPTNQGRLLPQFTAALHTFQSSDSITYIGGVRESQYEEVRGMAIGPLNMGKPNHAILLVTSGRAGTNWPAMVGGHAMVFDLSDVLYPNTPENQRPETWHPVGTANAADWPQFQRDAQRTGYYPGS